MKRLLVAILALTTMLTACSDDKETVVLPNGEVAEVSDADAYLETWENKRAAEAEEFNVDVAEYSREFNTEDTPADIAKELKESGDNPFAGANEAASDLNSELDVAIENARQKSEDATEKADSYAAAYEGRETYVNYHTRMDTVNIDVLNAELYRSGGQSRMSVEFNVENTANERKMVPLLRSVIVTDGGFQAEGDRQLSEEPEWELMDATKTSGKVIFDLESEDIDTIETVTLVIPGVDFHTDYEERIEISFDE